MRTFQEFGSVQDTYENILDIVQDIVLDITIQQHQYHCDPNGINLWMDLNDKSTALPLRA
ncbi:unnamed protein product [Dovyalis caffra]|uniref:Uncharacterized protein n=1 Tax=Dovyalis caffra TaxID=77055 RepID=A0AAV1RQC4_9ROSI|nr:unnamed protein product [Dovyalis caffra]